MKQFRKFLSIIYDDFHSSVKFVVLGVLLFLCLAILLSLICYGLGVTILYFLEKWFTISPARPLYDYCYFGVLILWIIFSIKTIVQSIMEKWKQAKEDD